MQFDSIPLMGSKKEIPHVDCYDKFYRFITHFNIMSVRWEQPQTISSDYFYRLISEGAKARARDYGRFSFKDSDESSNDFQPFYSTLLDHGALWKCNDGRVICSAMSYNTKEGIIEAFNDMIKKFDYPENVKVEILDNCYKYRNSGDFMLLIYFDNFVCSGRKEGRI